MRMNTFKSLPKLLPNRKYVVLTRKNVELNSDIMVFHDKETLLQYVRSLDEEVMVIGGAQIYSLLIDYADKLLLTEIEDSKDADVYFPEFDEQKWEKQVLSEHNYENIHYKHLIYTRK